MVEVVEIKILGNPSVAPLAVDGGDDGRVNQMLAASDEGETDTVNLPAADISTALSIRVG